MAPGDDQLFTPSYVVPLALVFQATRAGWMDTELPVSEPNSAYRFSTALEMCAF